MCLVIIKIAWSRCCGQCCVFTFRFAAELRGLSQDQEEALSNVEKRIQYITTELKRAGTSAAKAVVPV